MLLSVLIRNLNEAASLRQTLLALQKQQTSFEYEVVVVDNESDDDSVAIAELFSCRVFTLRRDEFTFGRALNYGIEKCRGEFILILSAHVALLNESFLQNIPGFFSDPVVGALRFVQAVSPDRVGESLLNGAISLSFEDSSAFAVRNWQNFPVNHCAAIRRECWKEIRFDEEVFASEDKIWSLDILKKGYKVLYNVPGFYLYTKPFDRKAKVKREIIEQAAKEMITGKRESIFGRSYVYSFFIKFASASKRVLTDLRNHRKVHKGVRELRTLQGDLYKTRSKNAGE